MSNATTPGLRDYLTVLRQQRVLIVLVVLVFVGVAVGYSLQEETKYRAEAKLVFREATAATDAIGTAIPGRSSIEQLATIGAETVLKPETQAAVAQRLGHVPNATVTSRPELRTGLVIIQATSSDPREAAAVASAFAQETRRAAVSDFRTQIEELTRQARREFRRLRSAPRGYREAFEAEADRRVAQLRILRRLGEPVEVASLANVPSSPIAPKPVRNTLFGLIAGLTLGLLAAFGRSALDRRLRSAADVAEAADLPLLGGLRDEALGQFLTPAGAEGATDLEGLRIVRRNIELLDVDSKVSSLVVTSAIPEEGKSTVAGGIAVASALAGKRTLLIDCDLRRPVVAARMGLEGEPGLTEYLMGHASPADVVRSVALPSAPPDNASASNGSAETTLLAVIPAGHGVPQPAELLGSKRFEAFLAEVGAAYELVVLDTPPLLPVADTLELLGHVDAAVLCARVKRLQRSQLSAARRALATAKVRRVGLVVTGLEPGRDDDTYGSYSYAYAPSYAPRS